MGVAAVVCGVALGGCQSVPATSQAAGGSPDGAAAATTQHSAAGVSGSAPTALPSATSATSSSPISSSPAGSPAPPSSGSMPAPAGTPLPIDAKALEQTVHVDIGPMHRAYDVIEPRTQLTAPLPAVVVLSGINAPVSDEEQRTGLLPRVDAGQLILVYPVGYQRSWNAGNCCGGAFQAGVADVAFVSTVLQQVQERPEVMGNGVVLLGYSNGGRMAYDVGCRQPTLMDALVVVSAVPDTTCPDGPPLALLQMASSDDPEVAYGPGDPVHSSNGFTEPTVAAQIAKWRVRNGCPGAEKEAASGHVEVQTWTTCSSGQPIQLATYHGIAHLWPYGDKQTPSGAQLVWSFLATIGLLG